MGVITRLQCSSLCSYLLTLFCIAVSEWEGGDDWLRVQFKAYLLSLFRTVASDGEFSIMLSVCSY